MFCFDKLSKWINKDNSRFKDPSWARSPWLIWWAARQCAMSKATTDTKNLTRTHSCFTSATASTIRQLTNLYLKFRFQFELDFLCLWKMNSNKLNNTVHSHLLFSIKWNPMKWSSIKILFIFRLWVLRIELGNKFERFLFKLKVKTRCVYIYIYIFAFQNGCRVSWKFRFCLLEF